MEGGIIVFHRSEGLFHPDFRGQFFLNFPFEGLFRCFSRLDLSSRKFPVIFKFSIAPLGGEDFVLVDDQCSHNVDCFQCGLPFSPYLHSILLYQSAPKSSLFFPDLQSFTCVVQNTQYVVIFFQQATISCD